MKHLNRLVLALVGLLLFVTFAHAAPAGDLSTQNRASFVARGNNDLTLGNQGSGRLLVRQSGITTLSLAGSAGVTSLGNYLTIDNATGIVTIGANTTFTPSGSAMTVLAGTLVLKGSSDLGLKSDGNITINSNAGDSAIFTSDGNMVFGLTSQKIRGSTTSTLFRDHADANTNIQIDDGGLVTLPRGELLFSSATGNNVRLTAYVPTMAATPVVGTNMIVPGLNVIPTAAANAAAILGPSTPVPGQQFRINNSNAANAVRIKAGGGATLNGAVAGGYILLAALASVDCFTASSTNYVCMQPVIPTPAGP